MHFRFLLLIALLQFLTFPAYPNYCTFPLTFFSPPASFTSIDAQGNFITALPTAALQIRSDPETWGRQRRSQWCWAACLQMALNYQGVFSSEEILATALRGDSWNTPAYLPEMTKLMNQMAFPDQNGRILRPLAWQFSPEYFPMISVIELNAGRPLIVGIQNADGSGHALVVTGVRYFWGPFNVPVITNVIFRDPWPLSPSRQEMTASDFFSRLDGFIQLSVVR